MSKVFISYAREDRDHALALAGDLEASNYPVWWDEKLYASQKFANAIEDAILSASAVVVIWSQHSVKSTWVNAECQKADGKLVGTIISGLSPKLIPLPHNSAHVVNLAQREEIYKAIRILRAAGTSAAEVANEVPALFELKFSLNVKIDIIKHGLKQPEIFNSPSGYPGQHVHLAVSNLSAYVNRSLPHLYLEKSGDEWKYMLVAKVLALKSNLSLLPKQAVICDEMIRFIREWPASGARQ